MADEELRLGMGGSSIDALQELERLLAEARLKFSQRNVKAAAESLSAAEAVAQQHQLYRQASVLRKALTILSTGGKPRLLTRPSMTLSD